MAANNTTSTTSLRRPQTPPVSQPPSDERISRTRHSIPAIRLEQSLPPLPAPPNPPNPRVRIQIPDAPCPNDSSSPSPDDNGDDLLLEHIPDVERGRGLKKHTSGHSDTRHLSPVTPRSRITTPRFPSPLRQSFSPYQDSPRVAHVTFLLSTPPSPLLSHSNPSTAAPSGRTTRQHSLDSALGAKITPRVEQEENPPGYEPMYDYLRSLRGDSYMSRGIFSSPNSNAFLTPATRPSSPVSFSHFQPYRDSISSDDEQPFVITLSPLSPRSALPEGLQAMRGQGPPSYEELFMQHPDEAGREELARLVREMDGGWREEVLRFFVGLLMLVLCVVGFGLAVNWGKGWGR